MDAPSFDAPDIALAWLARLRWLAVVGQITATLVAHVLLDVRLPLTAIFSVIATTLVTNVFVALQSRRAGVDARLVPTVMLLDVLLLTAILALTGGPRNPFCTLYVVHVVLSVILLGRFWTWVVAAMSAACFGVLFLAHVSIDSPTNELPAWAWDVGAWVALTLIAVLIAYFVGHMHRAMRRRDLQLSTMRERTERSARFAAVTALAAGAAHELGSPLGTIAVVAKELEIAAERAGAGDDITDDARLIRTEVDRCLAILDRMRLEVGDDLRYETRVVTAQEFIEGAMADLVDDRRPRVRADVAIGAEQFFLTSRAILRAAGVLLRNAFEASPPNSIVTIRLKHDGDRLLTVEVQDRGTGMPADVLKRAGEPFFTTKEMGRGMGMGLFLVKLVIENNDGVLELQSTPGQGTLARLIFPAPTGRAATRYDRSRSTTMTADPTAAAATPKPGMPRILCVDDDQIFRTRLVRAFTQRGFEVYPAQNAEEGMILAKRHSPERAIVDMRMPGMSGLDLIDELARIDPDIDIIVLTGYGSIATAVEAVRRGARDYLTKPVDTDQILQAFERDPDLGAATQDTTPSLARVEWEHIQRTLADCGGNISQAARKLGIHRRSLQRKLAKLPPLE